MNGEIKNPLVSIIMGSKSDWPTMEIASQTLTEFGVAHRQIISLLERLHDKGLDIIKTENRYNFDGVSSYSA